MLFCIGFVLYFLGIKTFANIPYFSSIVAGLVLELAIIQTLAVIRGVLNYYGKFWTTNVQALVSVKPAFIKVGTMGKRPVQESRHKVAETKVQGTTPTIPTLAIATSIM